MAKEPKTAQLIFLHNGKVFVLDDFPADKLDELKAFVQTLTQPAIVPNIIPQPSPSSSIPIFRDYNEIGVVKKGTETSRTVQERRKGIRWTEAEHRLFLQGLEKHGWGDWRSISRNCVVTRTPIQVASHAQKYEIRQNSKEKKKKRKRSSIHDVTHVKNDDILAPQGQSAEQAPPSPPAGIYAAPRIEQPIGGPLLSTVRTPVNLSAAGQSPLQAPPSPPAGIYAAPRIGHPIGGPLVSAVGTPVNLSAAGQSAEQARPTPPARIYAAPRIEHAIGGPLVSAVGTPVNLTAAGHMAYELGPDSATVMPGETMNLGPMTYPMQYTYTRTFMKC